MTLLEVLDRAPQDAIAVVVPETGIEITYRNLSAQVLSVAADLRGVGVGRGDRVAIALTNGLPAVVSVLAASVAGTAAPLNPAYRPDEFSFYLDDTRAKVLIVPTDGGDDARKAAADRMPVLGATMDASGTVGLQGTGSPDTPDVPADDDIALVLHTSGSTGRPKQVPLRHRNLTVSAEHVADSYALVASDVSLCIMPLFHIHGIVASTLATFWSAGTVVLPDRFNPLSFWRTISAHKVTWYTAVPTIHQMLLGRAEKASEKPPGVEGLRFIRSCSAPLAPDVLARMERTFGAPVLEAYGMTEAAHQMSSNPLPPGARKPGSVGTGTGVEIRIADEKGQSADVGVAGEVVIRGANVIDGYENNPEANATSFWDDWFRTGDQGKIDDDGYLTLVGRLKELINRGGEKISPREIDEVMLAHPAVAEAVCFGVPHKSWGEEVEAVIVLESEATAADIIAYCREKLAEFKVPKKIHIADAIPKTATGKIQRRIVAAQFTGDQG